MFDRLCFSKMASKGLTCSFTCSANQVTSYFFHWQVRIMFPPWESICAMATVQVMLWDFRGKVLEGCAAWTCFSWATCSWNPAATRQGCSQSPQRLTQRVTVFSSLQSNWAPGRHPPSMWWPCEWAILKADPLASAKPPSQSDKEPGQATNAMHSPHCRFVGKIEESSCFKPLSVQEVCLCSNW